MRYADYKKKYPKHKNAGDYCKHSKTITVLFDHDDPITKAPNFGNTYSFNRYRLELKDVDGSVFSAKFKAKSLENAIKQARREYKGCEFIQEVPFWGNENRIKTPFGYAVV